MFSFNKSLIVVLTPPWPVSNPDEKEGGLCAGPEPQPYYKPTRYRNKHQKSNNTGPRMEARQGTGPRTANHPIADILGPKSSRWVGCWNVRTLPDRKASQSVEVD
ncbi:hypothetical protein DPMN_063697 [Dreissena polymorpha]|uniref:Uncharacterized protein n=1 Tax=Dreissena polymorpha TaxID=45954 RepID=A0A9D4CC75_DREPO|nr:hypothetical protein DPMN_063697 [Dreissena polymorpha]